MPQQSFMVQEAYSKGLRRENREAVNSPYLTVCQGMRCTPRGLEEPEPIVVPAALPTVAYPYPALFSGKKSSLVVDDTALYTWDEAAKTKTAITVYDITDAIAPSTENLTNINFLTGTAPTPGTWTLSAGSFGTDWTLDDVNHWVTHAAGNVRQLQQTTTIASGALCRILLEIDGMTVGSVTPKLGATTLNPQTVAGRYEQWVISPSLNPTVSLIPSTDFDGYVKHCSIQTVTTKAIPSGGGAWQFADFGDTKFLAKENCTLVKVPFLAGNHWCCFTYATSDIKTPVIANVNNRLISGGWNSTTKFAAGTTFDFFWQTWLQSDTEAIMTDEALTMDTTTLFFSTQSGGEYLAPFMLELALLGFPARPDIVNELQTSIVDAILKGEMGFIPTSWQLALQNTLPFGSGWLAFCLDGISVISPDQNGQYREEAAHDLGIVSRGACCGSRTEAYFVDRNSNFWTFGPNGLEKLGYQEHLSTMVGLAGTYPVTLYWDSEEREVYITNGQQTFLYNTLSQAMSQIYTHPTGLIRANNELVGPVHSTDTGRFTVITEAFDMLNGEQKTIDAVETLAVNVTNLYVGIKWRTSTSSTFRTNGPHPVNRNGLLQKPTDGNVFEIITKGTKTGTSKLERTNVRWKQSGKRGLRGAYASIAPDA